ncbi:probable serine/threonine protein kinase IRE [Tanacetum coccineum]
MFRKNVVESILAERDILISVRNPFVVRFFYSFTCKENLYLVMEFLNGGDLFSLMRTLGCLEKDMARVYIAELHRGLLTNISQYTYVRDNEVTPEHRQKHSVVGTPNYLAPEILLGVGHVFANIMNRDIPWPKIPEEMSYEAYDLINKDDSIIGMTMCGEDDEWMTHSHE